MYEYRTEMARYGRDEDLMAQLNEKAALGWEVLTVYPTKWSKDILSPDTLCTAAMVVYRRPIVQ